MNHKKGVVSAVWSQILRIAGVRFEHQWSTDEYREFLEANGWEVTLMKEMPARITLAYAECVRTEHSE
ncbi:MAG: hypothetical protein LUD55_09015 [Oscillospiraceae bacterium]|nr:hypothetical protein [Oscillospiraceae bacterium]